LTAIPTTDSEGDGRGSRRTDWDGVPWMVGAGPVMAIALLLKAVRFEL
jgi:hypothetical protein